MRNLFILAVTAAVGLPAFAGDCGSVLQSLPQSAGYSYSQSTFIQQAQPILDVAPAPICTCQSALSALPSYSSLPLQTSAAAYAAPSYYLPSAGAVSYRSYAASIPQTYISRSFDVPVYHRSAVLSTGYLPQTRFLGPPSILRQRQFAPTYSTQFVPGGQFSPGGFRAGFAGQGLNNSGGGFLTGGGLIGGAANLLGVSSAGLEGAALGILATRSNLFGLAPRRR